MVSLGPNFQSGAQYMADRGESSGGDRQELLDPVLSSNNDGAFRRLKTVPVFSIHLFISTLISLVGILLAIVWPPEERCKAYFIMLYLRAAFWLFTFVFDHVVKKEHDNLRMNGYHEFHRATSMHKSIALYVVSLWNSVLLAVVALIHHFYGEHFWQHCVAEGIFTPIAYVAAFNVAETVVLAAAHSTYIAKVVKFNRAQQLPDAMRGANNTSGSLGLMQPGGNTSELLEKQADLIAYLKDHNLKLNQKLHQMQLNARSVNLPS